MHIGAWLSNCTIVVLMSGACLLRSEYRYSQSVFFHAITINYLQIDYGDIEYCNAYIPTFFSMFDLIESCGGVMSGACLLNYTMHGVLSFLRLQA